ncbi:hypothetical protein CN278_01275 [Bacillus thuringiensis]|nr:hypothetical protein CN278_01275 [Bacillus thuringiensis]
MMGRWCIGSMCDEKNGRRILCPFFLFGTRLNMLFLKKGSYIEKWSDSNEQNRGMQDGYYASCRY